MLCTALALNIELLSIIVCAVLETSYSNIRIKNNSLLYNLFFFLDIKTNTRGTCLMLSSFWMKAWMVKSCVNGLRTILKVPSMYHLLAFCNIWSWVGDPNMMWRAASTMTSPIRNWSHCKKSVSIWKWK